MLWYGGGIRRGRGRVVVEMDEWGRDGEGVTYLARGLGVPRIGC